MRRKKEDNRSKGVIYYNMGTKMLVRLAVSLYTLRNIYKGPVAIICEGEGIPQCKDIAKRFDASVVEANLPKPPQQHNSALLSKCSLHLASPFDLTIYIDSDTIIMNDFTKMYDFIDKFHFVTTQFCDWTTMNGIISRRIRQWEKILPESYMEGAYKCGPAINTGVFGFDKSPINFMNVWFDYAVKGKDFYIPDEISCQIIMNGFWHYVTDSSYNESCNYGPIDNRTKIIHFHGRKHCRIDRKGNYLYNSNLWYNMFDMVKDWPEVKDNVQFDPQLRTFLPRRKVQECSLILA